MRGEGSSPSCCVGGERSRRIVERAERIEKSSGLSYQVPPNGLTPSPPLRGFYWGDLLKGPAAASAGEDGAGEQSEYD